MELTICDKTCWCRICRINITPKTRYFVDHVKGYRGTPGRINICVNCLKTFVDNFTEQDKQECDEIKKRLLAKSISECGGG